VGKNLCFHFRLVLDLHFFFLQSWLCRKGEKMETVERNQTMCFRDAYRNLSKPSIINLKFGDSLKLNRHLRSREFQMQGFPGNARLL